MAFPAFEPADHGRNTEIIVQIKPLLLSVVGIEYHAPAPKVNAVRF